MYAWVCAACCEGHEVKSLGRFIDHKREVCRLCGQDADAQRFSFRQLTQAEAERLQPEQPQPSPPVETFTFRLRGNKAVWFE